MAMTWAGMDVSPSRSGRRGGTYGHESGAGGWRSLGGLGFDNEYLANGGFGGVGCNGGAAGRRRDAGEFHPLKGGLDAAESGAGHGHLVGGEDEAELLPGVGNREFGIDELVEGDEEGAIRRRFDSDGAGVGVGGPAFGWFGAHGFVLVDGFCGGRRI